MRLISLLPPGARFFIQQSLSTLMATGFLLLPGAVSAGSTSTTMAVSATVVSNSNCRFTAPASTTLAFGTIDPSGLSNVTATGSLVLRCAGSAPMATFALTDDSGLYETGAGAYRMQHAVTATAFLGYSVSYSPQSATVPKNTNQTITVTGTITAAQYGNAIAGNYTDTITVTVSP